MNIDRECGPKQGYLSKAEAKRVARMMSARERDQLHLYRCPHCRVWHVGHVVPSVIRATLSRLPARRAWQVQADWGLR